jgi:hypothetical protein
MLFGDVVALSDAGAVFQQLENLPSTTDAIARIANLPQNPLTGELKTAGDKLLGEIKNTALEVGKKILKGAVSTGVSAVTSLTVGASIGNLIPIPGIGAAIGAIGALVWEGLKALGKALLKLFRPAPQPYQRECPKFTECFEIPPMPIVDLIPWLGPKRVILSEKMAVQLNKWYCGHGGVRDCLSDISYFWKEAYQVTLDTIPYLGLPEIERLLIAYRSTPTQFKQFNPNSKKIELFTLTEPTTIIYHLEWRKKKLVELVARAKQIATMDIGKVPVLFWDLGKEVSIAAAQVQVSQSTTALSWYKTLSDFSLQLRTRDAAQQEAARLHSQQVQQRAAVVAADPRLKMQHDLDIAKMQCGDGNQAKCEEAKRLIALLAQPVTAPAATAAPARAPVPVLITKPPMSTPKKLVLVVGGTGVAAALVALLLRKPL